MFVKNKKQEHFKTLVQLYYYIFYYKVIITDALMRKHHFNVVAGQN